MSTPQPTVAPQEPESFSSTPSQESSGNTPSQAGPESNSSQKCPLSPGWVHAISTIMSYPLKSEIGQKLQKWVLYHEIYDPTYFWLSWDPTDYEDIRLLQKYTESMVLWSISQAAQSRTSSVSGTILTSSSNRTDPETRSMISFTLSQMSNGSN